MSIIVEHDKRRKEILEKALDVFMDEGFEDATFQKIADRCSIFRTTLYIYFKNKKEIFNYSIKQLLAEVEEDILRIRNDTSLDSVNKITQVLFNITGRLEANRRLLAVILDYLLHLSRSGANPETRVRRRTVRLRHILASMIIEGVKAGELTPVNIKAADDLLYGLIESAIFRLVILKRDSAGDLKRAMELAVKGWQTKDG
ncbi:MAG: TetR/AcrR family transcriptional regulator [Treponema sp.]|jgi:AcrR family transcriptional regulator|nr:TetR/AcrR family transcriptional regulator [Treponema sp.]